MAEFSVEQARAFYDWFGRKQDWQWFYEDRATRLLVEHSAFGAAHRVVEFGCGTGRFAEELMREQLPPDATYLGVDVSSTMVALASERLRPWANRIEVRLSDGSSALGEPAASVDRFVSIYVLDLLSLRQIGEVLQEAHRLLRSQGLLCLMSLTHGRGVLPRIVSGAWQRAHELWPAAVGGCRPLDLTEFVRSQWRIVHVERVSSFAISSQVLVATRSGPG